VHCARRSWHSKIDKDSTDLHRGVSFKFEGARDIVWELRPTKLPRGSKTGLWLQVEGFIVTFRILGLGFQQGSHTVLQVLKMCIRLWKSMEIPNSAICLFTFCSFLLIKVSNLVSIVFCIPWIKFFVKEHKW